MNSTAASSAGAKKRVLGRRCAFCGVYEADATNKRYYGFPKNETRCKLWAESSKVPLLTKLGPRSLRYYHVCSDHFVDEDFISNYRRRLKPDACPRFHTKGSIETRDTAEAQQSENDIDVHSMKERLKSKLKTNSDEDDSLVTTTLEDVRVTAEEQHSDSRSQPQRPSKRRNTDMTPETPRMIQVVTRITPVNEMPDGLSTLVKPTEFANPILVERYNMVHPDSGKKFQIENFLYIGNTEICSGDKENTPDECPNFPGLVSADLQSLRDFSGGKCLEGLTDFTGGKFNFWIPKVISKEKVREALDAPVPIEESIINTQIGHPMSSLDK